MEARGFVVGTRLGSLIAALMASGLSARGESLEIRQAAIWTVLLLVGQTTDVLTTAIDRARGALESMPASARLLEVGGVGLFWSIKLLLVVALGVALLLTARWAQRDRGASRITFRFCLVMVQAATLVLAWASLNNVALLSSLLG